MKKNKIVLTLAVLLVATATSSLYYQSRQSTVAPEVADALNQAGNQAEMQESAVQDELPATQDAQASGQQAELEQAPIESMEANQQPKEELPVQPKKQARKQVADTFDPSALVSLLKKNIDLNDPTVGAQDIEEENLTGQAYKDFWVAFHRNKSHGTTASQLRIAGRTFQLVSDTPDNGGCNYFYDEKGRFLISACGSDETSWSWRPSRPHYLMQAKNH